MSRIIGLDVHSQSTVIAVMTEAGKRVWHRTLPTSASELISAIQEVPKPRRVILEEGNQSEWLTQALSPFVEDVVVTVPPKRPLDRIKNDVEDAYGLAEMLRRNAVDTRVFKAKANFQRLRSAYKTYRKLTSDCVRSKNRLTHLLQSQGIREKLPVDPSPRELGAIMKRLPEAVRFSAEVLVMKISHDEELRAQVESVLIEEASRDPAYKVLLSVPGIGQIRAATLLAVVVDPHRFRQREQFANYCGLGLRTAATAQTRYDKTGRAFASGRMTVRGLMAGNMDLKEVLCGAALHVTAMKDSPLQAYYRGLLARGLNDSVARIHLARKLSRLILAVWKSGEAYDPKKLNLKS